METFLRGNILFVQNKALDIPQHSAPELNPVYQIGIDFTPWAWDQFDNNYPSVLRQKIAANPTLSNGLNTKAKLLFGSGIEYGTTENGKFVPKKIPDVEIFLQNSARFFAEACNEYAWFNCAFVEFRFSANKRKIISLATQETQYCRFSPQINGEYPYVLLNAQWHESYDRDNLKHLTLKRKTIPVYDFPLEFLKNEAKNSTDFLYIFPVRGMSTGTSPYPDHQVLSCLRNGTYEVAQGFAAFRKNIMEKALQAKFMILIHDDFWEKKFPDWHEKPEEQRSRKEKTYKSFEDKLSGNSNAGGSIGASFDYASDGQTEQTAIKIIPIDHSKFPESILVDEGEWFNFQLLHAAGVPGVLLGNAMGKTGFGAGSGSDIHEMKWHFDSLSVFDHQFLLEPIKLAAAYNGHPDLEFRVKQNILPTLDKVNPDQRP